VEKDRRPPRAGLSDERIVARVRAGEPKLFEVIMRRHAPRLQRAAHAIVRDAAEAEDVAQDALVRAYAHLHQFKGEARLATWLTSIAVHEALARNRRRGRLDELRRQIPLFTAPARGPEQELAAREVGARLHRAVRALPPRLRRALLLRTVAGLSTAETAARLAIPEDTVKTHLFRARERLRRAFRG